MGIILLQGGDYMAKKVLFTYDYGKENMKKASDLGYELMVVDEKDINYSEALDNIEVLVCYNPFNTLDISLMKNLKWIQLSSIGIDQLPVKAVKEADITVTNNRGGYSIPMGEWVVMKILELHKNSFKLYKNQMSKVWKMDTSLLELYGKVVGFIGTGSIALETAKRLQGFGVNILGLNTSGKEVEYFNKCYSMREIDNMLSQCDVVVITIPSTKETFHLISEEKLGKMKDGVFLVNVARGNILDEKVLVKYLENKKIGGAALDVFEEEPLSIENPLWNFENVTLTPHNSWISEMRNLRRWNLIYENLRRYINGEELNNIVDIEKGY
jgi:phosphoglycerate dehydrogenase-like enzyme